MRKNFDFYEKKIIEKIDDETKLSYKDFRRVEDIDLSLEKIKNKLEELERENYLSSHKEMVHGQQKKYYTIGEKLKA